MNNEVFLLLVLCKHVSERGGKKVNLVKEKY